MTVIRRNSDPQEELRQLRSRLTEEAERLLTLAARALKTTAASDNPEAAPTVNEVKFHEFRISALSWLTRIFGNDHTTTLAFKNEVTGPTAARTRRGVGIVEAAKGELQTDWLQTARGEMAQNILTATLRRATAWQKEGNHRAAAILCGSVIDDALRRVAQRAGISLVNDGMDGRAHSKKPLQLTGELYKKRLYERATNKQLISWIELSNQCAKDDSEPPEATLVEKMLQEVEKIVRELKM